MAQPFISVTTDFAVQSQGLGIMEAVAFEIAPTAKYVNLMHGLPSFDLSSAARTLETVAYLPVGCHVCVVDPGVGSTRKPLILRVGRGDFLVGPDNGVLLPATRFLGGIEQANLITNRAYMRQPVSPLFHGRDVFMPTAGHLANGIDADHIGPTFPVGQLRPAPYDEATVADGSLAATVIHLNHFGSAILNIRHDEWDKLGYDLGSELSLRLADGCDISVTYGRTFSDVHAGNDVLMKDDYGRIEVARNLGHFVHEHRIALADIIHVVSAG